MNRDKVVQIINTIENKDDRLKISGIYLRLNNEVDVSFYGQNYSDFVNKLDYKVKLVGYLSIKYIFQTYKDKEERIDALYEEIKEEIKKWQRN